MLIVGEHFGELLERGVQRRGLARPGRPGHEEDPVRALDDPLETFLVGAAEPEVGQQFDYKVNIEYSDEKPFINEPVATR